MNKKHFSAVPFVAVLVLLAASLLAAHLLRARSGELSTVNLGADARGEFHTVRVFDSISTVLAVDGANHARKREIAPADYAYDRATTRLTFSRGLPFPDTVVHVEGRAAQPERFVLHDFPAENPADSDGEAPADSGADSPGPLVVLDARIAAEDLEYSFDRRTRTLTFRDDIHPESGGNFHIRYEAADGGTRSFGNFKKEDMDILSELEGQWRHRTRGAPMFVMKARDGVSDRELSREVGFPVSLPKARSELDGTFVVEIMEENERRLSVQRWFGGEELMLECRGRAFERSERILSEERIELGGLSVAKSLVVGSRLDAPNGEAQEVPLVRYDWERDGAFYQIVASPEQAESAERIVASAMR